MCNRVKFAYSAHSHGSVENRTRYWNAYMLFYEEVKKEPKGGLAPPLIRGGEPIPRSPISPLPEGGDKLTQLQVTLCIVVCQSFDQTL